MERHLFGVLLDEETNPLELAALKLQFALGQVRN